MRMRFLVGFCMGLSATVSSAQVDTGEVGVAWDAAGEVCNLNIGPGEQGTLFVLAYPRGIFEYGITGSEFWVNGLPAEWPILEIMANPRAQLSIGNPLGPGCNIAFPSCEDGTVVLLYTIRFMATSVVSERVISVVGHDIPSIPNLPCPRLILCDGPVDFFGCSQGGTAAINYPDYCVTSIAPTSWSNLRALYR